MKGLPEAVVLGLLARYQLTPLIAANMRPGWIVLGLSDRNSTREQLGCQHFVHLNGWAAFLPPQKNKKQTSRLKRTDLIQVYRFSDRSD
jgi:hypothetical protein